MEAATRKMPPGKPATPDHAESLRNHQHPMANGADTGSRRDARPAVHCDRTNECRVPL